MKILHFADSHFSSKRLDECVSNFKYMVDYGAKNNVDMFVGAGDLFDANTMINSNEYNSAVSLISEMSGIAPVVLIRGNHDPDGSLDIFNTLRGLKYSINAYDTVGTHIVSDKNGNDIEILALPYINPIVFNALGEKVSAVFDSAKDYYDAQILEFKKHPKPANIPKAIIAHLSVYGAELANNEKIVANEVMLDVDSLDDPEFDAVFLGHIHRRNQSIFKGTRIRYSAPHYRISYGEKSEGVGFIVWDINAGNTVIDIQNTPAKEMVEYHMSVDETKTYISSGTLPFEIDPNVDTKIVADVSEGTTHMFDKEKIAKKVDSGSVKINLKTIPKTRVRSKSIANNMSVSDKVREWISVSGVEASDGVFKKADYLESILSPNLR